MVECRSNFLRRSEVALQADPDSAVGRLGLGLILRGDGHLVEMPDCHALIEVRARRPVRFGHAGGKGRKGKKPPWPDIPDCIYATSGSFGRLGLQA